MLPDHGPGDLVVALGCGFHRVSGHVIKRYHVGQNAHRLVEGAEPEDMKYAVTGKFEGSLGAFDGNGGKATCRMECSRSAAGSHL